MGQDQALKEAIHDRKLSLHGLLDLGARTFHPMLALMEGNSRDFPTKEAFERRAAELQRKFKARFKDQALKLEPEHLYGAFNLVQERQERWPRVATFLRGAWPYLKGHSGTTNLEDVAAKLERVLEGSGLPPVSLVYLVALDSAFSPKQLSRYVCPGREILKPDRNPSDQNLYNVVCDIWALEMATQFFSQFGEQSAAVCTNDRGIIGFWALLRPRDFGRQPGAHSFTLSLTGSFAPTMPEGVRARLFDQLTGT